MLPLLLLLLSSAGDSQAQLVLGQTTNGSCVCEVEPSLWAFPVVKYESVLQQVQSCNDALSHLQARVQLSTQRLPHIQAAVGNVTARLEPFHYLNDKGLYTALTLRLLGQELSQLETDISVVHGQLKNPQTQSLTKEVGKLRRQVDGMQTMDSINMKTVKEKLRYLKNTAESCKSIPTDFKSPYRYCFKGLIANISAPVVTKISPYGKAYTSGSWGKEAQLDTELSFWVQPLLNSHIWGHVLRLYHTYEDFMSSTNHQDFSIAPANTHKDAIEGPSAVLYGGALYYHCYRSPDVCRFNLTDKTVARLTLPGTGVGFNNKFPYCYYDCKLNSDVDLEADETGLWVIYATAGNHGNIVLSRLIWDEEAKTLNITQTWETRQFKKAVSNAFMACGVLYATRFLDEYREEVFYAFDPATGREDNSLAMSLEKVAKGVASLSYNPTDKQVYMYNDGYLLAYQAEF
ncbi:olfactomedin-4-like [Genypterus blacodes]|uniref:olfactomedin-4-like n=1 Tax=Genypterus blacodes TaxID=154954 RepID=UPI003F76FC86